MKKEKFVIKDPEILSYIKYNGGYWDENDNQVYGVVNEKETYHDMEKGYYRKDIVIERISDGKFFKGNFLMSSHHSDDKVEFTEVTAKKKTITTYE